MFKRLSKVRLLVMVFMLAIVQAAAVPVQSHVLETDTAFGAVIHVEPNDDPYAGTNSNVIFEVTDKSGAFDPAQCYCMVQVLLGDQVVTSTRIEGYDTTESAATLFATVVFPEVGVYKVQLIGKPVTNDWFDEFLLEYEVRVVRQAPAVEPTEDLAAEPDQTKKGATGLPIGLVGLLVIVVVIYRAYTKKQL